MSTARERQQRDALINQCEKLTRIGDHMLDCQLTHHDENEFEAVLNKLNGLFRYVTQISTARQCRDIVTKVCTDAT